MTVAKKTRKTISKPAKQSDASKRPLREQVKDALSSLKKMSTKRDRDNLQRFAIMSPQEAASKAFGVSMSNMKKLAKSIGRDHELAAGLWETGNYEARMLASLVDEPERVTAAQMERWCRDFDNWAICDTASFCLFDRTPHAWPKVAEWSDRRNEFEKRTAFALLWSLTVHDKHAADNQFVEGLRFIEKAATDDRNFVKKAVNMALRAIGKRNAALNTAAIATAKRLASSDQPSSRWVGKDALRELTSPSVRSRLTRSRKK